MSPMESALCRQGEEKRVAETRDVMMQELSPHILEELTALIGEKVSSLFADWNLSRQTGMLIGVTEADPAREPFTWPDTASKEDLHKRVARANALAQKVPGFLDSFWLSDRVIVVKRADMLVEIERALVREGFTEVLRLVKRPLERGLFERAGLERSLQREIDEIFLDWDFRVDVGYIVLVLKPENRNTSDHKKD